MPSVWIVREPAVSKATGHPVNGIYNETTDEVPNSNYAQEQSHGKASQTLRCLTVEELLQSNHSKHIRNCSQNVLRNNPQEAHRNNSFRFVHKAEISCYPEPPHLNHCSNDHRDDRENQPDADPLQRRDTARVLGVSSGHWDKDSVIDWEEDHDCSIEQCPV
ncbi:Os01g0872566 [Oryza sativa Japonica Group]|uniref:Os01g0872566 protein n=1 Tax=Oryza sativa subsp. japonica TaxID=39947 RepID=A0A0P0VAZ0_ORYSJ|nr:hypothetical protein EE612_007096 [Oryza sativa]BAS75468.1 Os01g0872566 [Oryza sativa Japonica Group]